MPPDLNSLPPSRSQSGSNSPLQLRPSQASPDAPRVSTSSPHSPLAAAASMNAAGISPDNRRRERRRSSLMTNLNLNDPGSNPTSGADSGTGSFSRSPIPMATADPHHHRAPSLGELHQELEAEQEAQVNRLLSQIRQQQIQLETLQRTNQSTTMPSGGTAVDDSTPTSERSFSIPSVPASQTIGSISHPRPASPHHRLSHEQRPPISRHSSRASGTSRTESPSLRPLSRQQEGDGDGTGDFSLGGRERDESAYYRAETQTLSRENQMLKQRIRELERQVSELSTGPSTHHSPARISGLSAPPLEARSVPAGTSIETEGEAKDE
ncbi:MAG: hypothetical protein M1820_010727 [Bogoriella megaspora]|nr:MAG: hypothetical protein M1820_010727 [Bogoriella megaspora]